MAWVETDSLSFTARHDDADTACAQRVLDELEELRLRLEERFDEAPGDVTIVIHDNPAWLSAAHPLLPAVRWAAAPAGRRYLAGWPMAGEIHVLSDEWMERRAAGEDSLRALKGTAARMYCQLVLAANNTRLPPMWTPRRFLTYLRWAWLVEGASQYFTGQTGFYRAAVITRLREGDRPAFPPSRRDAIILGGTVFDLLDRHAGPRACGLLASRLRREGPAGNLELTFEAPVREIERAWRRHLDEILYRVEPGQEPLSEAMAKAGLTPPEGQPTLRRQRPRRDPDALGDLDVGTLPEFGFDTTSGGRDEEPREPGSAGSQVEEPDQGERRQRSRRDPGR